MRTTEEIKTEGFKILIEKLGILDAEKFITYIIREPFDYTEWQRNLFDEKNAKDISKEAMAFYTKQKLENK